MVSREILWRERKRTLKIIKRFLYFILALIMLLCVLILVCAFQPALTEKIAAWVSGTEKLFGTSEGVSGDATAQLPEYGENGKDTPGIGGNISGDGVYVPPAQEEVASPDSVKDRNGYEPVRENGQEIGEEDARKLQAKLETGETGANFTFDAAMYPYYGMLNQNMQALYRQVYANAMKLTTSFAPVVSVSPDEVRDVFEAVYNDHPELFWVETGYSCKYLKSGECIELTLQYYNIASDLREAEKKFNAAAQEILKDAEKLTATAEKERYVHDALISRVDYHGSTAMGQSAYSALVSGRSVCAGYARAFQYLMMELGVPCYYCTGYSGENHAWNIVNLDDGFYNVDVTWDDTKPSTYDYYNKTDADYSGTHMRTGMSVKLPVCTGEAYRKGSTDDIHQGTVDDLINDYPNKPLTWNGGLNDSDKDKEKPWEEIGLKEEEIMDNLEEYYADCLNQMKKVGTGYQQFTNVIPKSLWDTIERIYSDGSYKKGYVEEALKEFKLDNFAIQLQTERLNGAYYRLYHNISTW